MISSIGLFIWGFRNVRLRNNYRLGFSIFGLFIALSIPTLFFLIPGLLFLVTKIEFLRTIGFVFALLNFLAILHGIVRGRWNWKLRKIILDFDHLPASMDQKTFIQISDIHVGSFFNKTHKVKKAIELINHCEADYLVFTGDLVNNKASEFEGWEALFSQIKVKQGKYSILGNHDYGDYVHWEDSDEKTKNLHKLIATHKAIGWTPLLNEAVELQTGFWLLGVENWGSRRFKKNGKLQETLAQTTEGFKLLLSHDPSHFDAQVVHTDIDLTLSGHTHGMQFGIERFFLKWSPVSLVYPKWAGLYKVGTQYLYVNRGFGYLGFPGRVGIYPEITEITLRRKP